MFINIHSHQPAVTNEWVIRNKYDHFEETINDGCYSIGLHPWYIDADKWPQQMQELVTYSTNKNILAIGECGLDKVCATDLALQQQVFAEQIKTANAIGKPLIIHCVKAFEEVLQLLQQYKVAVPVIFHGFNKSKELAQQLTGNGYYLSFGKALQLPAMQKVLTGIPPQQIFLETDDAALSIEIIYGLAAKALSIDTNTLSLQIKKNAADVFVAWSDGTSDHAT